MKPNRYQPKTHFNGMFIFILSILMGIPFLMMGSKDNKNVILQAMQDELSRSKESLQIENLEKPYFIDYTIIDYTYWTIKAGFGSLTESKKDHQRKLKVNLRVGDYSFDNTGFLDRSNIYFALRGSYDSVVVDNDYHALRKALWLATDEAYKEALKQMAGKKAYLKTQIQDEIIPDFSKEKPVKKMVPLKTLEFNQKKWEQTLRELSALFRQFPKIHESQISLKVRLANQYFCNSEGTVFLQPEILIELVANATSQTPDGAKLKHFIPYYANSFKNFPPEKELIKGIKQMAKELTALTSAPVLKDYIGPVIFTQQAATELFAQMLTPHLSGQRAPESNSPGISQLAFSSKLAKRLNRKVLPREMSVTDDPTLKYFKKIPLLGSYDVDEQGVVSQPTPLVEKGKLKTLLMSRRPRKEITQSNGHGRTGIMGKAGVSIGNLLITSEKGKSLQQLKKELLEMCKEQELEFGLMIKSMDNPSITGTDDRYSYFNEAEIKISAPIMVYRVFVKDGREELIRGLSISDLSVGDFKNISSVGNDEFVMHRLMSPSGGILGGNFGLFYYQHGSDMGIPTSIVAPSILFEEIELEKSEGKRKKPPLMPHPFFGQ